MLYRLVASELPRQGFVGAEVNVARVRASTAVQLTSTSTSIPVVPFGGLGPSACPSGWVPASKTRNEKSRHASPAARRCYCHRPDGAASRRRPFGLVTCYERYLTLRGLGGTGGAPLGVMSSASEMGSYFFP